MSLMRQSIAGTGVNIYEIKMFLSAANN